MKKKYKLKKSAIIILILFLVLIIALFSFISSTKPKSYSIEYNIDEYEISENYDNKDKFFYYEITYKNLKYNFISNNQYQKEKKLIYDIKKYTDNDYICLTIESDFIKNNPLCSYKQKIIDYRLVSDNIKEKLSKYYISYKQTKKTHENYKIYDDKNDLLIWSYKGFNYLSNKKFNFIKLFNKDIYDIPLATKINNYIVVPDYEQEHKFDKVYIINLNNKKVKEWKLKYKISFDSYILGTNNKSIYLLDKKNKIEYELVPHKKKMRIIATSKKNGIIFEENQSIKISMNKLISKEYKFLYKNNYKFSIKDNNLYLSYLNYNNKIKISNKKVDRIIHIKNDEVFYLVYNTLYKYNLKYGEIKVIEYSEWEFNNKNLIFIS